MHRIFVYGTLKRGLENHGLLFGSTFVGRAHTVERYSMLDGRFPVLRDAGSERYVIDGELYDVDDKTLAELDDLEGIAEGIYNRAMIDIVMLNAAGSPGGAQHAFAYIGCGGYWDCQARDSFTVRNGHGHLDWIPSKSAAAKADDE